MDLWHSTARIESRVCWCHFNTLMRRHRGIMWRYIMRVKSLQRKPPRRRHRPNRWRLMRDGEKPERPLVSPVTGWFTIRQARHFFFFALCCLRALDADKRTNSLIIENKGLKLEAVKDHKSKCHIHVRNIRLGNWTNKVSGGQKRFISNHECN